MRYDSGVARTISATLLITQSLASAGLIANATINPIIGEQLSGQAALAGVPGTLLLLGAASSAYPAGQFMQRAGRRPGLALGFAVGAIGMVIGGAAVVIHSFLLFLLGLALIGVSRGAIDQARYAAADAQTPERRSRAIANVVFAGTVGAILGPKLVAPLGAMMQQLGLDPLSGSMFGGAALFAIAAVLIMQFLRPDPRDIAAHLAQSVGEQPSAPGVAAAASRSLAELLQRPTARLAAVAMIFGQGVMVLVMTVTSLHMHHHGQDLDAIATVLSSHTLGMFLFSPLVGRLADRIGRRAVIEIGSLILMAGCLLAPFSLATPWIALALYLVGLGWNFCYIGGSSLLTDGLAGAERSRLQGGADITVNAASAVGSLGSGFVMAAAGFGTLCVVGLCCALPPLLLALWQRFTERGPRSARPAYAKD